ncbi:hypothetical protein AB0J80_12750 [Actinoplanes sp. NPDC049548]|uniref:hypothetical protein n=1 Tax=Actinoplanes sp. NPDC049548 TaxID=3155152 RepID=UPI003420255A
MPTKRQKAWESLAPWEQAAMWAKVDPAYGQRVLDQMEIKERHLRRMDWVHHLANSFCGLVALGLVVWLTKYFVDQDHATQGASVFIASGTIIGIFVTKKLTNRRPPSPPADPSQPSIADMETAP